MHKRGCSLVYFHMFTTSLLIYCLSWLDMLWLSFEVLFPLSSLKHIHGTLMWVYIFFSQSWTYLFIAALIKKQVFCILIFTNTIKLCLILFTARAMILLIFLDFLTICKWTWLRDGVHGALVFYRFKRKKWNGFQWWIWIPLKVQTMVQLQVRVPVVAELFQMVDAQKKCTVRTTICHFLQEDVHRCVCLWW